MTLNEIMVSALQQLKRGRDSQTIDNYRATFCQYANMAIQDLSKSFPQFKTESVELCDGAFNIEELSEFCIKLISVRADGIEQKFEMEHETGIVDVLSKSDITVDVCYRFVPKPLKNATDTPALPEQLHQCIVSYIVACERLEGDPSSQNGASIYFKLYNDQKRLLMRGGMGVPSSYDIKNVRY